MNAAGHRGRPFSGRRVTGVHRTQHILRLQCEASPREYFTIVDGHRNLPTGGHEGTARRWPGRSQNVTAERAAAAPDPPFGAPSAVSFRVLAGRRLRQSASPCRSGPPLMTVEGLAASLAAPWVGSSAGPSPGESRHRLGVAVVAGPMSPRLTRPRGGGPLHADVRAFLLARGANPLRQCNGITVVAGAETCGHWLAAEIMRAWARRGSQPAGSGEGPR